MIISPWIALAQTGLIRGESPEMVPSMAALRLLDEEIG